MGKVVGSTEIIMVTVCSKFIRTPNLMIIKSTRVLEGYVCGRSLGRWEKGFAGRRWMNMYREGGNSSVFCKSTIT